MGYFKSLAESAFKKNPDGEGWLYYPNGFLGKGRLVASIDYKNKLFKFQKRLYTFGMPLGILYGISLGLGNFSLISLTPIVITILLTLLRQYWLVKDLPKSNIKLRYKEATAIAAKGLPTWYFYLLYVSSGLVIIMGLSLPFIFNKPYLELGKLPLILIAIGVAGFIVGPFLQKLKNSNKVNKQK